MKQLSGMDASFLYMETPNQFGHVSSLSIFEMPDDPDYEPYEAWRSQIEARLHTLEPLTRRLLNVPLRLDHPWWVQDPDFDLDFHVRHTAVPPPGTDGKLTELVARIVARPLDRSRPLWESYVIEGLEGDRFAILTKVHHATVDGASGAELLTLMLNRSPEDPEIPEGDAIEGERLPSATELLARTTVGLARKPGRLLVLSARTLRDLGRATRNPALRAVGEQMRESLRGPLGTLLNLGRRRPPERDHPPARLPSASPPRTIFNRSISPHRKLVFRTVPLGVVKDIKSELGVSVNDVVMAVCAGGLRSYLDGKDALPGEPLVTMVPVSVRTGEEAERWTNRVAGVVASLPTDVADPIERVRHVHESMEVTKDLFLALPAKAMLDFAEFPPPALFTRASRMATRFELANRVSPPVNLVISNVPGPREPLYAAGARLLHYYPISVVTESQGLNITVQSYMDNMDFGLVACAELLPDVHHLGDAIVEELGQLAKAVGVREP